MGWFEVVAVVGCWLLLVGCCLRLLTGVTLKHGVLVLVMLGTTCLPSCLPADALTHSIVCMGVCGCRFYNQYPCIIITAKGQPDVATRYVRCM